MIFIYPAIVTENVDTKIVPAVSRTLEQFYLLHLQESFSSGNLRVKTIFNPSKGVYGSLILENKKVFGQLLLEIVDKTEDSGSISFDNPEPPQSKSETNQGQLVEVLDKYINDATDLVKESQKSTSKNYLSKNKEEIESSLEEKTNQQNKTFQLIPLIISTKEKLKTVGTTQGSRAEQSIQKADSILKSLEKIHSDSGELIKFLSRKLENMEKDVSSKEKKDFEKEKWEKEQKEKELSQYETHGSYKVEPMKGVSFKPSMANISVRIHYVGGPHEEAGKTTSLSEHMQEISIGAKILPLRLKNFNTIEDALLDDYFSTPFSAWWKALSRGFQRASTKFVEKVLAKFGIETDLLAKKEPVKGTILLAPKGYVEASSFKKRSNSAAFYNYASAIVIFNKDELSKEEGANFFLNREHLLKMFKMGWNAFCILDPVREEAMFISSLDGGYLHTIPYSYIFNSLGMDQIYASMSDLQRRTPIFRKRIGNIGSLISRLRKEFVLLTGSRNAILLNERKNGKSERV